VTQKKYNRDNFIVLMIINFLLSAWSLEALPVVYPTQKFGGEIFDFRKTTALLFGTPLIKAQND